MLPSPEDAYYGALAANEFVYCPRLFYMEWVDARWASNLDTDEGSHVHRNVDRKQGAVSKEGRDLKRATSVKLSCPDLGLVGVVDLLEPVGSGLVEPVEFKKGRPADDGHPVRDPERIQLCALGLLLRANGYASERGSVYFNETRERVAVEFDDELVEMTMTAIAALRPVADAADAPPPLVDSPKCPRCSLVGLCLPDEVNLLSGTTEGSPRRLIPSDDNARPVYVSEPGAKVSKSGERLIVKVDGEIATRTRLIDVSQLCVFGNVQVTTQTLHELFRRDIPTFWFSYGGWLRGTGNTLSTGHVALRRRQVTVAQEDALAIASSMIAGKIRNTRTLLMRNARPRPVAAIQRLKQAAVTAQGSSSVEELLGVEGAAARTYWSAFASMLKPDHDEITDFDMQGRNRRPPLDPVNCLLGYAYSLLTKDCVATLTSVGLDPCVGVLHAERYGRPALALDLAEEFRPLIAESVVIGAVNNGEVRASDFVSRAQGVSLTRNGRRTMTAAYERRLAAELTHPVFGYRVSYRRAIEVQARMIAATLLGDIDEYTALVTR